MTGEVRRGDLFWIAPDDAGGDAPAYAHPHVVVQDDLFNRSRVTTVIVCALTTNLKKATEPGNVLLDAGEGELPRRSAVVVSQIASVEKARLGARIGALSQERVEQILAGLRFQQTSFFARAEAGAPPEAERVDRASLDIPASPAALYAAFATPARLMRWLPPGTMTGRALEYDFREGGRYRIALTWGADAPDDAGKTAERADVSFGCFLALDAPHRIVQSVEFEATNPAFAGVMLVTWTFEPADAGRTRASVKAEHVPPGISAADHVEGLQGSLANLAAFVCGARDISIRDERPGDAPSIRELVRAAFREAPHAGGDEQDIVEGLRAAGALSLSLVAALEGEAVGHVAASPVEIEDGAERWYGIGPLAVAPRWQGRGIGAALMHAALERLRADGAAGCVLLGAPDYYGRFGFQPAAPLVLPGAPAAFFLALELGGPRPRGRVRYHDAFGVAEPPA